MHINRKGPKIKLNSNHLIHTGTYLDRRSSLIINEIVNSLCYLVAQVEICLSEEKKRYNFRQIVYPLINKQKMTNFVLHIHYILSKEVYVRVCS